MANLESQRKQVQIVINFPINAPMEDLENFLSSIGCHYAWIMHDKDIHEKDIYEKYDSDVLDLYGNVIHKKGDNTGKLKFKKGDYKTRHIHLVLDSLKKHRLGVFLNYVCDVLNINENQVGVLPCESLEYAIQYLIHKNDKDKHQYNVCDIHTNYTEGVLCDFLEADVLEKLTTQNIIDVIIESHGNRIKIIEKLGIGRYTLYRNVINDVYRSLGYLTDKY